MTIDDRRGKRWEIRVREGNDYTLTLTPTDPSGNPVVVSAASGIIYKDRVQVATFTTTVTPITGVITMSLTAAQTDTLGPGTYKWELVVTDSGQTIQWLTDALLIYAPGSPQTYPSQQAATLTVGDQVNVLVEIPTGPQGPQGPPGPPPPTQTFTVNGGTIGGSQPTFSGAPLFTGQYVRTGDLVHFQIQVDFDNILTFGTGQYFVDLPFLPLQPVMVRGGCLHDFNTGLQYHISGHADPGSLALALYTTDIVGQNVHDFAFTSTEPVTLSTADNFHIQGTYIAVP